MWERKNEQSKRGVFPKKKELTSGTQKSERNQEVGDGLVRRQETNGANPTTEKIM
jgi:hypothetical protein